MKPLQSAPVLTEQAKDQVNLITDFRRKLMNLKTMERPLRWITIVAFVQMGLVALLLATPSLPLPDVVVGATSDHQVLQVSFGVYALTLLSLILGWSFILTAATRLPLWMRLVATGIIIVLLGFTPYAQLGVISGFHDAPFTEEIPLRWLQLGLLAIIASLMVGVTIWQQIARARHARFPMATPRGDVLTFGICAALIASYYGAELAIIHAYSTVGIDEARFGISNIDTQSRYLPFLLAIVIYFAGTDIVEWGQTIISATTAATNRAAPWLTPVLAGLVAIALLVDVLRRYALGEIWPSLVGTLLALGIMAVVVWLGQPRGGWPTEVSLAGIALGALLLFCFVDVAGFVSVQIAFHQHVADAATTQIGALLELAMSVIGLVVGLALIVWGRTSGQRQRSGAGLLLVMVGTLLTALITPQITALAHLPPLDLWKPAIASFKVWAAVGALALIIIFAARRTPTRDMAKPVGAALCTLVGLQTISWLLFNILPYTNNLAANSALVSSAIFLIAVVWDVLTSGDTGTNGDTPRLPRAGRVLLYLGYSVIAASTLLYVSNLHYQESGANYPFTPTSSDLALVGLFGLGVPFALFIGFTGVANHFGAVTRPQTAPVSQTVAGAVMAAVVSGGGLALAGILIFGATTVWPHLPVTAAVPTATPAVTYQEYQTNTPGPGCATGALWQTNGDITVTCQTSATQFQTSSLGVVAFVPANNAVAPNYQVTVTVDLADSTTACLSVGMRSSPAGRYDYFVCSGGIYLIYKSSEQRPLYSGSVPASNVYTIVTTANGTQQSLEVNGQMVQTFTDSTFTKSDSVHLGLLDGSSAQPPPPVTALVSHFDYKPLP